MEKLIIVKQNQELTFERKAAELDITIIRKTKSLTEDKIYFEFFASDLESYYLVNAMGLLNELEAIDNALLN